MTTDFIRRLRRQGKLTDIHVEAAAKFIKLVYAGYSSKSLNLEASGKGTQLGYLPNLSGMALARLPARCSETLTLYLIKENTLETMGYRGGAKSKRDAYRVGLVEIKEALELAYSFIC